MNYDQAITRASSHFLRKSLPEECGEWEEEELNEYLEYYAMLGMDWDVVDLWDCIETLAYDFMELTKE